MKIVHYLSHFSLYSETFIYDLVLRQETAGGYEPHVVTHYPENLTDRPVDRLHTIIYELPLVQRVVNKLTGRTIQKRMMKVLDDIQPDVIHCHFAINAIRLMNILGDTEFAKYSIAVSVHGTDVLSLPKLDAEYAASLKKLAGRNNVTFIANSHFLKNELSPYEPRNPVEILYNTFHSKFRNVHPEDYLIPRSGILKVITVGRLIKWKGHIHLINAIRQLKEQADLKIQLTIVGEGDEFERLERHIDKHGLQYCITLEGSVDHSHIPRMLAQHDLYVQPSVYNEETGQVETFGVSVLEAVAVGLPVVVTNTGGLTELIGHHNPPYTYIVESKSPEAIAAAISDYRMNIEQISKDKKSEIYASILKKYSNENQLITINSIYETIKSTHS